MIVVATSVHSTAEVCCRLVDLGARDARVVDCADGPRRLVLAETDDDWTAERVTAALRADGHIAVTRPDDGARLVAWQADTSPVTFGDRLAVCFAWSEHARAGLPPTVELGLGGFGSGHHPTTRLLIGELLARIEGGERVLDVGCGSGVLGLCALQLGAADLVAVDVKPTAVAATARNAALNGVARRVRATLAPLERVDGVFDVVMANVGRAAIVELAPQLMKRLAPTGWLAVSGISPAQSELVGGFLRPLVDVHERASGEWSAVVFAHGDGEISSPAGRGSDGDQRPSVDR